MRNQFITCVILLFVSSVSIRVVAQENMPAEITSVVQNDGLVEFTVESGKPFYVGGNIHILHIGNVDFKFNRQVKKNGKNSLTFLIPIDDYKRLPNGTEMWMSYGNSAPAFSHEKGNLKKICEENPGRLWYLGTFNNGLLKK